MSVSIKYKPTIKQGVYAGDLSSNVEKLEKVFGTLPVILTNENIRELKTLFAVTDHELYLNLIHAIEKHDEIEVYAEY